MEQAWVDAAPLFFFFFWYRVHRLPSILHARKGKGAGGCSGARAHRPRPMRTRTGVLIRMGWLPFYRSCHLPTAIDSIEALDPLLLQCTCLITQPSGAVKRCRLRFTHTETFELSLSRVRACDGSDSHNRCACCLEWVFRDGVRCHCCHHRLHRRCAAAWLVRSKSCPTCRTPWIRANN